MGQIHFYLQGEGPTSFADLINWRAAASVKEGAKNLRNCHPMRHLFGIPKVFGIKAVRGCLAHEWRFD